MEMYNVSELENAETYMIQGTETELQLTNSLLGQFEAMYNEGAPEFVVDQGVYYPTATNYGYYCTGFESPGEWDGHHGIFGLDGADVQYTGAESESLPYVYYTPSYGYSQSPYNPYNPYIPGAMIGVDGSFVGGQQYYSVPPYQTPAYVPVVQPDIIPNSLSDPLLDTGALITNRLDRGGKNHNLASASVPFSRNHSKHASNQTNSWTRVPEGLRSSIGSSKQPVAHASILSGSFPTPASSHAQQGRSASGSIQGVDNISNGKVLSHRNQIKVALPGGNGSSDFRASAQGRATGDKLLPKYQYDRAPNDVHGSQDSLVEQNRGPRTSKMKNQLSVKAYTTKAGDSNSQGNIIINIDQYNKDDFQVDYPSAKFFVIKSYSEDDVHKSIKYNVWSSTPHGNKKVDSAYEDALRVAAGKPRGCPIFLFFSVNASGQFCGVAEIIGPVDFNKDMDFWQQDKWIGCFPVEWHIIKDVPNTNLRHIILENNEDKPVTNSRDTQEIMYKIGLEMLKLFKNHTLKTSLLDDFMYYETRQKVMQDEKGRRQLKSYGSPFFVPLLESNRQLNSGVERTTPAIIGASITDKNAAQFAVPSLKIGSLSLNPKQADPKPSADTSTASAIIDQSNPRNVIKVGSVPVKVNGYPESSFLTVGTIPLDPRALKTDKGGASTKNTFP